MGNVKTRIACIFLLILLSGGIARAFVFTDPTALYSTTIFDQWVFQAHQSTANLIVFYGEGDSDLLYFERLGAVSDPSLQEWAERSLVLYAGPGGLQQFQLQRSLQETDVDGQAGLSVVYSYENERGHALWEHRVFLVLPDRQGFSITLSSDGPWVMEDPLLMEILGHWRWLF
ncbi:MAG: hypothetical protein QM451_05860 [Bacillota bacterium]|jgi:hypothetical protein|nr:hypothetical protein [Bacillota bacterium]HHT90477.1 DUF1795 domain-containing protein [Bacillota bacterium]